MIWSAWWAWMAAGIALAILEVIVPGFIFLGFAIGAVVMGALFAIGLALTLAWALVIYGLISLAVWIALRQVFGIRKGQVKTFEHDINED